MTDTAVQPQPLISTARVHLFTARREAELTQTEPAPGARFNSSPA